MDVKLNPIKSLESVKVGDRFAVVGRWHSKNSQINTVPCERVTKTQAVIGGRKYRKKDGGGVGGGNYYYPPTLYELTDEIREYNAKMKEKGQALRFISENFSSESEYELILEVAKTIRLYHGQPS